MKEFPVYIFLLGLVMFGVAIGSYTQVAEFAFMIIGGGLLLFSIVGSLLNYLNGRNK